MDDSVKNLIDTMIKETLDFIISIPSFSFDHWKIFLPLYTGLIGSLIYGYKKRR
jgi:hypothetical protein